MKKQYVICDVDGTLADCSHRQHFITAPCECGNEFDHAGHPLACPVRSGVFKKDWPSYFAACPDDPPIQPIIDLVRLISQPNFTPGSEHIGKEVIIVSGRPIDQCGKATEYWLDTHQVPYTHLFMRQSGDKRPDTIVKREILDLLPKERIAYVIDDRPAVLRMWQEAGLTTLAVGSLKEF